MIHTAPSIEFRAGLQGRYPDVYTPEALRALAALLPFNRRRLELMAKRQRLRSERLSDGRPLEFLDPREFIPGTRLRVQAARDGDFEGADIPPDLARQWIQGTGPASRPGAATRQGLRQVAYALLSGADGWMFDGEDALGQVRSMSLDNQRNLKLAVDHTPVFLEVAREVSEEVNGWTRAFLGREAFADFRAQLDFSTRIFRARGLHLDDRHVRESDGTGVSASIVDLALYLAGNHQALTRQGRSMVLYLPKIQTAEEAALWNDLLSTLEAHLGLGTGAIKVYVLVEQLEACFQLLEIRAALGRHFVGFNTGRWDYINSVADARAGDPAFINPDIETIQMTWGYMAPYEDRVRRAVNTPDRGGRCALWQGGMEPNIPVGSSAGVAAGMARAVAGARREQEAGASGKWVAHWKMVPIVRPVWEQVGQQNQLGRVFPRLTYTAQDTRALMQAPPGPRTVRGARNLISVALQYGNAFGQGHQAAALKPADDFGQGDVLYLMEDMATGEIRLSILWEWLHKGATFNVDDPAAGIRAGDPFTAEVFGRLLTEEYDKLLRASDRDVHDHSKATTLPVSRAIVERYVLDPTKSPWFIDLLNLNLDQLDLAEAGRRIARYMDTLTHSGQRITSNVDFTAAADRRPQDPGPAELDGRLAQTQAWMEGPRFGGLTRLHGARQVVEQQGRIASDYTVAREAAEGFYRLLRALQERGESITTFGPYSPGQAVTLKRMGIPAIYLGGWATSAKGSVTEDPGADLACYPLSQVPDEAAPIVRALLAADKNQFYNRLRMSEKDKQATPPVDYSPYIIADADTGHGGDAHVRNLIRRFVEAGVPGYHIEDQKPGVKKCGHQGGKVLVPQDEQNKRLNAARFQLDIMRVPGLIVARTDAESATFLDGRGDERDHPFIYGATRPDVPSYKVAYLALLRRFHEAGHREINGFELYRISEPVYQAAYAWFREVGLEPRLAAGLAAIDPRRHGEVEVALDRLSTELIEAWQAAAGLKTFPRAVADVLAQHREEGAQGEPAVEEGAQGEEEWLAFARGVSEAEARERARSLGIVLHWDAEAPRTPEGYYQIEGGIDCAIHRSLAAAPFADLLWMETKTADLNDARRFAEAVHVAFPDKLLAYNLSPSFNWDSTGMSDEQMLAFPRELGRMGYVFNFITYGGHQIDGAAAEEFASSLRDEGMLALARLQRKFRLVDSPYRKPQTLVGGPRLDGGLMAATGCTAMTKAMGKGSTQFQHGLETELPVKLLETWLQSWVEHYGLAGPLKVELKPLRAGSELLELALLDPGRQKVANVVFAPIQDRRGRQILSIRDQNNFRDELKRKRLMILMHLYLIERYHADSVHYVTPTPDNQAQTEGMKILGIYDKVALEIGDIIVAHVAQAPVREYLNPDRQALKRLTTRANAF